eukprot:Colp12_sorted_trinity150504_noHs@3227
MGKKAESVNELQPITGQVPPRKNPPSGPIENRSCRDVICCLLFIVFWGGMFAVAYYAFKKGDPSRFMNARDSSGHVCGTADPVFFNQTGIDLSKRPYLFFFDISKCVTPSLSASFKCNTPQVCVEKCPSYTGLQTDYQTAYCQYGITPTSSSDLANQIVNGNCAFYTLQSTPVLHRCMPDFTAFINGTLSINATEYNTTDASLQGGIKALTSLTNAADTVQKVLSDIEGGWYYILAGVGIAMILAFMWIVFMRCCAGPVVWLTILLAIGAACAVTALAFWEYKQIKDGNASLSIKGLDTANYQEATVLAIAIILAVFTLIVFLIVVAMRKRISIAIQVVKEAGKAIQAIMTLLVFPIFPFIFIVGLFAYWVAVAVYLATASTPVYVDKVNGSRCDTCDANNGTFYKYETDNVLMGAQIYHVIGLYWGYNFIIAFGQCVIAGAVASWYWARNKPKDIPMFPVLGAVKRTLVYHLGSLAFGSLILSIIQVIRLCLELLDNQLKKRADYKIVKWIMCCLKCCFWCLEKIIKLLNKNAYIEIAVYGYSFCKAARTAFGLLTRNCLRLAAVDTVGDFVLFLGKLTVTVLSSLAAYYFFTQIYVKDNSAHYIMAPVLVVMLASYMVAATFFSVYEMAIDTIFLCFCEDVEHNDGSAERPYYMGNGLKKILKVH